jgi:hypothetical protein
MCLSSSFVELDGADNHLKLDDGRLIALDGGNLLLKLDDGRLLAASSAMLFRGGGLPALVHKRLLLPHSSAAAFPWSSGEAS